MGTERHSAEGPIQGVFGRGRSLQPYRKNLLGFLWVAREKVLVSEKKQYLVGPAPQLCSKQTQIKSGMMPIKKFNYIPYSFIINPQDNLIAT